MAPLADARASRSPATAARRASATAARSTSRSPTAVEADQLVVAAVLSGNRNFEGRIHPARAGVLPRVAAARRRVRARRAGRHRPHHRAARARPRTARRSCSPTSGRRPTEVRDGHRAARSTPELFRETYAVRVRGRRPVARAADPGGRPLRLGSRRRRTSPTRRSSRASPRSPRRCATSRAPASSRCSATRSRPTTSARPARSPPGRPPARGSRRTASRPVDFNSYGARRGHHEVMMRGTFGNIRLRNRLVEGKEGPYTRPPPRRRAGVHLRRRDALPRRGRPAARSSRARSTAPARRATGPPRARRCSGSGRSSPRRTSGSTARTSSGWASCRSSSSTGENAASLGLTGREAFTLTGLADLQPRQVVTVVARSDGRHRAPVPGDRPARRPDRGRVPAPGRDPARGPAAARRELTGARARPAPTTRSPRLPPGASTRVGPRRLGEETVPRGGASVAFDAMTHGGVTALPDTKKRRGSGSVPRRRIVRGGGRYWARTSDLTDVNRAL